LDVRGAARSHLPPSGRHVTHRSFLPKTGTVNSDALESRAKEKLGRVLGLLSKRKGAVK
jgi:hypothetical protein